MIFTVGLLPPRSGITMIEAVVGVLIASFLFYILFSFTGNMAFSYKHTFVELENFREAHLAISGLRRDYRSSCPYVNNRDGIEELKKFMLRPFAMSKTDGVYVGANRRIRVTATQIVFYKFADHGFSENHMPVVEEVEYRFDKASGCLLRKVGDQLTTFEGFKEFEFQPFVYEHNSKLPVIWVRMVLDNNKYVDSSFGKPLEITTTISGAFSADAINYSSWHYRTYHRAR